MNEHAKKPRAAGTPDFQEVRGKWSLIAFLLGMAVIAAAIVLGRCYPLYIAVVLFSALMTLLWQKAPRPWISLVSILAATPIALLRQQFSCNVLCGFWFTLINLRYLARLPRWIYPLTGLALLGLVTSSINWLDDNAIGSAMRQGALLLNFVLAPFLLLPMIYFRLEQSCDSRANLQGLLFCLIVPSTLILVAAKLFGTVTNAWEASMHIQSIAEGFLRYRLGRVVVNFLRTEVGFILAALICASAAVAVSQVGTRYRLLAGACLASNAFLLLVTASFGSGLASFCGLAAIFHTQFRTVRGIKVLASFAALSCLLVLTYALSPPSMKGYLEKRYEHHVTNADTDRLALWGRGVDSFLEHPEGVGWTLSVGEGEKTYMHNDYLVYAVSYGITGGLAYLSLVFGLLISFFQVRQRAVADPCALAVQLAGLGVIVAVAVNSMTDHMTENRWYFTLIWSLVWYSYFCSRPGKPGPARRGVRCAALLADGPGPHPP